MGSEPGLPGWSSEVLRKEQGLRVERGIARFPMGADDSIAFYRAVGGAHFHERSKVSFAMSSLDTPVYHGYLEELSPDDPDSLVVDVGGGDGRNATPWLRWGFRRLVVVDAVFDALDRLRTRVAAEHPEWLDRILLIEADARSLPLVDGCATRVVAVEALAYLNDDYGRGLAECARLLASDGRLMLADRDYEGGLLARLHYFGGITGMLEHAGTRNLWDGTSERLVRNRCFTEAELRAEVAAAGLRVLECKGISALSLVISELRGRGGVMPEDEQRLGEVHALLKSLGRTGAMRRSHVIVAGR